MDIRDQLKNLFPEHEEQDFEMPEEKFEQNEPLICKFEKKGRNGKPVTLIEGFEGSDEGLKQISKKIKNAKVFGKPNAILGNILSAEIVVFENQQMDESEIRNYLEEKLQTYKIPRRISFVEEIGLTRTGKKLKQ